VYGTFKLEGEYSMFNGLDELEDFASRLAPLTPEEEAAARQRTLQKDTRQNGVVTPIRTNVANLVMAKAEVASATQHNHATPLQAVESADKVVEIALTKAAAQQAATVPGQPESPAFVGPLLPPGWTAAAAMPSVEESTQLTETEVKPERVIKAVQTKTPVVIDMTLPPEPEKSYLNYSLVASGLLILVLAAVLLF